jgi:hypothetical protein
MRSYAAYLGPPPDMLSRFPFEIQPLQHAPRTRSRIGKQNAAIRLISESYLFSS